MLHHFSAANLHGIVYRGAAGEMKLVNGRRKRLAIGGKVLAQQRFMVEP